jgi:glycosyltransferase involved in cell wall biosynthesis
VMFVANPSDAELGALYARCCALIFPSLNEDWGIVPLEAMAHGKPVLAVNRGGPVESVVDGETGYLLEPTPAAFARAMTSLAAASGLAERLGRQAAERAKRYSWDRFVKRLDDYFEDSPTLFDPSSVSE